MRGVNGDVAILRLRLNGDVKHVDGVGCLDMRTEDVAETGAA